MAKASNVVKLPAAKKPSNNPAHFNVSGDVKPNGDKTGKQRVAFNAILDFSDVDMTALYRMAAQTIVIKLAGNCRSKFSAGYDERTKKHAKSFDAIVRETLNGTINVKETILPKMRANAKVRKADKIVKDVESMNDVERAAMFAKLSALMPKAKK